jgi:tRNA pseudouridine38-40 synthase
VTEPEAEHYFTADPSVPFKRAPVETEVWGHRLSLVSGSGVFAQGRLDVGAMDAAAATLVGLHDFAAYCRPREGATTIRTLQAYRWTRAEGGVLVATLQADAFCHSMVRALVGACVAVGEGRLDVDDPEALLNARERTSAFKVMPAKGLVLTEVGYPDDHELEARAAQTRARRELHVEGIVG